MSNQKNTQRRVTVILGSILALAMVASAILPLLSSNLLLPQEVPVQPTVAPTIPAPPDTNAISFDQSYLHPSGLFTAAIPSGWETSSQSSTSAEAQVTMRNNNQLSVVEMRLIQPDTEVTAAEDLNDIFDQEWLNSSWREYTTWNEATRSVSDDRLVIDFNLSRGQQQYIARQLAYTDGDWVYAVRVVMPPNASQALQFVLNNLVDRFAPNTQFIGEPVNWSSYFDESTQHLIRFPQTWTLSDAAPGQPASIQADGVVLRVETQPGNIADEDAASAWLSEWRPTAELVSVEAIEREGVPGYSVAYTLPTLDGPVESGVAVLLNGPDETVHIANLRLDVPDLDLNSADTDTGFEEVKQVLQSFGLFSNPDISASIE